MKIVRLLLVYAYNLYSGEMQITVYFLALKIEISAYFNCPINLRLLLLVIGKLTYASQSTI